MLKGIKFIVTTNSEKERRELVNFIASRKLLASFTGEGDGYQLLAISTGDVWFISPVREDIANKHHYISLASAGEFISCYKENKL